MCVFTPETYNTDLSSPDLARGMIQEMVACKHSQLKRAHLALLVGFILRGADLVVYLGFVPKA